MKNLVIIQARMGSSRLPGKIMMKLAGKPMLEQIVNRVKTAKNVTEVMVATTTSSVDDKVFELCNLIGVKCFRGSENDVLDRYYQAANMVNPDNVIRITADCPLIDPFVIDEITEIFLEGNYDYVSNTLEETYPDGLDTEVFTFDALKRAWREANLASEREHVTPYIKFHDGFRRHSVTRTPSLAEKRWTIDTQLDYELISLIYDDLYEEGHVFNMQDVLNWLSTHEKEERINEGIIRNEGYLKSLREDYIVDRKEE